MIRKHAPVVLSGVLLLAVAGAASAKSVPSSSEFMKKAASDGIAEVEVCRLAMQRSHSAELKRVAKRLMDDHLHADAQLAALARRKHVHLPSAPEPEDAAKVQRLRSESATHFDPAWVASNIDDHRNDIRTFRDASKTLRDADTRHFAAAALPVLRTHLHLVEALKHHR